MNSTGHWGRAQSPCRGGFMERLKAWDLFLATNPIYIVEKESNDFVGLVSSPVTREDLAE